MLISRKVPKVFAVAQNICPSRGVLRSSQYPSPPSCHQPTPPTQINPRVILPPTLPASLSPHDMKPPRPAILRAAPQGHWLSGKTYQAAAFPLPPSRNPRPASANHALSPLLNPAAISTAKRPGVLVWLKGDFEPSPQF